MAAPDGLCRCSSGLPAKLLVGWCPALSRWQSMKRQSNNLATRFLFGNLAYVCIEALAGSFGTKRAQKKKAGDLLGEE